MVCKVSLVPFGAGLFFIGNFIMTDYNILIIGAGPAGSTLARLAPLGLKIAVMDKSGLEGERPKPCGGLLSPDAQKFLARSELTLPKEILVTPQIFAVKTIDLSLGKIRLYQRSYLNMDREKFDEWLRSLIPERVTKINARCTAVKRIDGGFEAKYLENGEDKSVTAEYIVGADGANSIVRRTFFPNVKIRRYVAIQQWFSGREIAPFYSCVFDRATSDCCSWSISKDDYMIYGGAVAPKGCRDNFNAQLKSAQKHGFEFGDKLMDEACMVCRPQRPREIISGGNGVLLLGEAGGFISPSSLEGISWAMRCGEYAAMAFEVRDPCAEYRAKTQKLRFKLFLKMLKCPFMYNPILRRAVLQSGVKSLKHI